MLRGAPAGRSLCESLEDTGAGGGAFGNAVAAPLLLPAVCSMAASGYTGVASGGKAKLEQRISERTRGRRSVARGTLSTEPRATKFSVCSDAGNPTIGMARDRVK